MTAFKGLAAAALLLGAGVDGQSASSAASCASTITPKNAAPSVAPGWKVDLVASGLSSPRGIKFDSEGGLLVVEKTRGVSRLTLNQEKGSCVRAEGNASLVIDQSELNHGLEVSEDGKTVYASSSMGVFKWDYDASSGRNTSGPTEIINRFGPDDDHVTRTLLLSRKEPGLLVVSRGSLANVDPTTLDPATGHSQIKTFNLSNQTDNVYSYAADGLRLGWGLRNSVGVAEHPETGGIYSVENSVDNFERSGQNIHQNNPGEELNFHGFLNGSGAGVQGLNYGYPTCFSVWNNSEVTLGNFSTGTQVAIGDQNATVNDEICRSDRVPPVLTFQAHQAPLDLKFNTNGTAAWVTFHGSWNRDEPIGYKVSIINFENGAPTEPPTSTSAAHDVVANIDNSRCPDECFRPVGMAWDDQGRLFFSSDLTGEIYVITREDGSSADAATGGASNATNVPRSNGSNANDTPAQAGSAAPTLVGDAKFVALLAGFVAVAAMM